MKLMHFFIYSLAMVTCATIAVVAEPSQEKEAVSEASHASNEPKPNQGAFTTVTALTVDPPDDWNPDIVPERDWPVAQAPTNFNRNFEAPSAVWRIAGGFLGSFDKGEFGGALFYLQHGAKKWSKIADAHVSHLQRFEGDSYLAVGGMAHGITTSGCALLLTRDNNGKWNSTTPFDTQAGVPRIVGTTFSDPLLKAKAEKLIVIALDSHWGRNPLFGISQQGTVHYLGEHPDKDKNKQGHSGKSASPAESKSSDKPEPETEERPR
jgi:hypothetical protein